MYHADDLIEAAINKNIYERNELYEQAQKIFAEIRSRDAANTARDLDEFEKLGVITKKDAEYVRQVRGVFEWEQ
jgi:predicted transcriptional regulator